MSDSNDESKPASWWANASEKAAGFDPKTAPAYQEGEQQISALPKAQRSLYEGYTPTVKTHEQIVQSRLGWIVAFTGIVAVAVVADFIVALVAAAS